MTTKNKQTETAIKPWIEMGPLERRNTLEQTLKRNSEQMAMVLPNHYTVGKLIGTVMMAIVRNPKILECTQVSILGAIWEAGQIGLSPNGLLGEGSLVPYNNSKKINGRWEKVLECQFLPEYRGLLKLAYKSPLVKSIQAEVVYEKDEFRYSKGLVQECYHVPSLEPNPGELTHVYAIVHLNNGGVLFDVMSKNQVDTIRLCSQNADGPAWTKFYSEMAKKSILRRIFKVTPVTEDTSKAVSLSERAEILNQPQLNELELVNQTVFSEITEKELDPNAIYQADYTEENEKDGPGATSKSEKVVQSALNQVKAKNGNGNGKGNGNGHAAKPNTETVHSFDEGGNLQQKEEIPDNVEMELRKIKSDIIFYSGEEAAYREDKELKKADDCAMSLKALKMRYRNITGKEYTNNNEL